MDINKLKTKAGGQVLYIGESGNLRARLIRHAATDWGCRAAVSWAKMPDGWMAYQRHEIGNDLIGRYYSQGRRAPGFQFGGWRSRVLLTQAAEAAG